MTKRTDDTKDSRIVLRAKPEPANPVSGGKKAPLEDGPAKTIRSLLERGKTEDALLAIQDPETMVQLKRLISRNEKDDRVKWRAAQVFTSYCVERKEWDRVSHLLRTKDQAIREGAISALGKAAEQEAHKMELISGKARSLLGGRDMAAGKGALREISEAAEQEAHKLAIISGLISEAVGNGNGRNSLRAAHALYRVIKQGE